MRQFPREIEADLLFRGIDVFDWHRGEMSSRRLLALIDILDADEDSALSRERRDGDWSLKQYLDAAKVNEIRRMRADHAAVHAREKLDVAMVESPAQKQEQDEVLNHHKQVREHIMSQLKGQKTE